MLITPNDIVPKTITSAYGALISNKNNIIDDASGSPLPVQSTQVETMQQESVKTTMTIVKSDSIPAFSNKKPHNDEKIDKNKNLRASSASLRTSKQPHNKPPPAIWESADINSKTNIKLNLFSANAKPKPNIEKRPKSASQAVTVQPIEPKPSGSPAKPFLTYSKFQSIEANANKQHEIPDDAGNSNNNAFVKIGSKTIELKFDLPTMQPSPSLTKQNEEKLTLSFSSSLDGEPSKLQTSLPKNDNVKPISETKESDLHSDSNIKWSELPHEVWLQVLKYLKSSDLAQFGRTCKTFHVLYTDQTLWRSVIMKNQNEVRDEWLIWIAKRQPNELSIIQCNGNVSVYTISEMFRAIGNLLTSLNLSSCFSGTLSGDNVVLQASVRCPNIRHLDLSWTLLSNESLVLIADSFKIIESINLSGCNMIKEDGINRLVIAHGETLHKIEIFGCFHLSSDCLTNIAVYCKNLIHLNIGNCHRMNSHVIMECSQSWSQLKFLDVRGLKSIKNNCVSQIMRKCEQLDSIALANCQHITDTSILEIVTYKPKFKYIDVKGCKKITDFCIISMLNSNVALDYFDISATSVTDQGLKILANTKCSKTVRELNLSFLPINDLPLKHLILNCPKLKNLYIYGCYNVKKPKELNTQSLPNVHYT